MDERSELEASLFEKEICVSNLENRAEEAENRAEEAESAMKEAENRVTEAENRALRHYR